MKFCTIDEHGRPSGFYDEAVHGRNIPEDAFEISDDDWNECLSNPGCRAFNEDHELLECRPPEPIQSELTASDRVALRMSSDPAFAGLVDVFAAQFGFSRQDVADLIVNKIEE